jgi:hypothetical protein
MCRGVTFHGYNYLSVSMPLFQISDRLGELTQAVASIDDRCYLPGGYETERARFAETLLALDDRDDLSPEEEALAEMLTLLIEDYEEKNYPLSQVSPNESLNALMEERGPIVEMLLSGAISGGIGNRLRFS